MASWLVRVLIIVGLRSMVLFSFISILGSPVSTLNSNCESSWHLFPKNRDKERAATLVLQLITRLFCSEMNPSSSNGVRKLTKEINTRAVLLDIEYAL
jgi:hypothetical protein